MLAGEVMTTPAISVKPDTSLSDAIKILTDNSISGVPVVDDDDKVVGILSEADFVRYTQQIIGQPLHPPYEWMAPNQEVASVAVGQHGIEIVELVTKTTVEKLMSRDALTVKETTDIKEIVQLMAGNNINRVPVVDEAEKLVGIVTRADVIANLGECLEDLPK